MDDPRNMLTRVRVIPRDGLVELLFERHHIYSPALYGMSTFVVVTNFDHFWNVICTKVI